MGFRIWLEAIGRRYLHNPTKEQFLKLLHSTLNNSKTNADYNLRGLIVGPDVYWWDASLDTHAGAAGSLGVNYNYLGRMNAYMDRYGDVNVSYDSQGDNHPEILKLGLDDDGVMQ